MKCQVGLLFSLIAFCSHGVSLHIPWLSAEPWKTEIRSKQFNKNWIQYTYQQVHRCVMPRLGKRPDSMLILAVDFGKCTKEEASKLRQRTAVVPGSTNDIPPHELRQHRMSLVDCGFDETLKVCRYSSKTEHNIMALIDSDLSFENWDRRYLRPIDYRYDFQLDKSLSLNLTISALHLVNPRFPFCKVLISGNDADFLVIKDFVYRRWHVYCGVLSNVSILFKGNHILMKFVFGSTTKYRLKMHFQVCDGHTMHSLPVVEYTMYGGLLTDGKWLRTQRMKNHTIHTQTNRWAFADIFCRVIQIDTWKVYKIQVKIHSNNSLLSSLVVCQTPKYDSQTCQVISKDKSTEFTVPSFYLGIVACGNLSAGPFSVTYHIVEKETSVNLTAKSTPSNLNVNSSLTECAQSYGLHCVYSIKAASGQNVNITFDSVVSPPRLQGYCLDYGISFYKRYSDGTFEPIVDLCYSIPDTIGEHKQVVLSNNIYVVYYSFTAYGRHLSAELTVSSSRCSSAVIDIYKFNAACSGRTKCKIVAEIQNVLAEASNSLYLRNFVLQFSLPQTNETCNFLTVGAFIDSKFRDVQEKYGFREAVMQLNLPHTEENHQVSIETRLFFLLSDSTQMNGHDFSHLGDTQIDNPMLQLSYGGWLSRERLTLIKPFHNNTVVDKVDTVKCNIKRNVGTNRQIRLNNYGRDTDSKIYSYQLEAKTDNRMYLEISLPLRLESLVSLRISFKACSAVKRLDPLPWPLLTLSNDTCLQKMDILNSFAFGSDLVLQFYGNYSQQCVIGSLQFEVHYCGNYCPQSTIAQHLLFLQNFQ